MKGKMIQNIKDYNGQLVWVDFENPDAASCANCEEYGLAEARLYASGVYRVENHFLVSPEDESRSFHEFTPRILAIYEWQN